MATGNSQPDGRWIALNNVLFEKCERLIRDMAWTCDVCQYVNTKYFEFCEVCKHINKEDIIGAIQTAAISGCVVERKDWTCSICKHLNRKYFEYCELCGYMRWEEHLSEALQTFCIDHSEKGRTAETQHNNKRRIVLIGKTGSGKSSTANTILGKQEFKFSASGESITQKCQMSHAQRFGYQLSVVDTPGLFDTGTERCTVTQEIIKCVQMLCPGPHVFLLVVGVGRFTREEQTTVDHFVETFGEKMFGYMVVIFTRKDDLDRSDTNISEFIKKVPPALKNVLRKCKNRYVAFDNTAEEVSKQNSVHELLNVIDDILLHNNGEYYTNEMFREAELVLQQRTEKEKRALLNKEQQEIKAKTERLQLEYQDKLSREVAENLYYEQLWEQKEIERSFRETEIHEIEDEIRKLQQKIHAPFIQRRYWERSRLQERLQQLEGKLANIRRKHRKLDEEEAQRNKHKWQDQDISYFWKTKRQ